MLEKQIKKTSKFLSLVLRHQPETIGITLDEAGWTDVEELLGKLKEAGRECSLQELQTVVSENDKQRFQFSEDGTRIRATQGHSVEVELGYEEAIPPDILLHGTPEKYVEVILREGLNKQHRHAVHMHCDTSVATSVGQRRGKPVLLAIDAKAMSEAGYKFFVTPNKVWLTDYVPPEFLSIARPEA
ncbi:MAG: RNA 2'-phosphotransferase [Planctomycetota bacterium]